MPSSAVRLFSEPDQYAAAVRATRAEVTITGRGHFAAKLTRIDLHRLWLQRGSESLPRVAHAANMPGRAIMTFSTQPGPDLFWAGLEMRPDCITRFSDGETGFQRSTGPASWASMSLPVAAMVSAGAAIAGCDLAPPRATLAVVPPAAAMARLQRLHADIAKLAEQAPHILAHPEAARGAEQALVEAMVICLAEASSDQDRMAQQNHALVMRRFRAVLQDSPDQALYIPELCAAIGVSARSLRACCHEHLGMGPRKYLALRRLHLVRRALRDSTPPQASVTDVAMRFGFWELGRFAAKYRSLFGEMPSATLVHPPSR